MIGSHRLRSKAADNDKETDDMSTKTEALFGAEDLIGFATRVFAARRIAGCGCGDRSGKIW